MMMATPIPFGKSTLNNSPLAADGSDFPCKQRPGVYDAQGANNVMPIGAKQTLSFIGSAVHGGGSCQLSLTTDKEPTKDSKWQVIHSIEGGCPASAEGNLPEDPNGSGAAKFDFSIPDGIKPGDYVLAWTWFNKIGNREMYMNCAPVTVTGGSKKRQVDSQEHQGVTKRDTNFPEMFVANVGNGCDTSNPSGATGDLQFPDPGSSLVKASSGTLVPPHGTCGSVSASAGSSGDSGSGTGAGAGSGAGSGAGASSGVPSTGSSSTGGASAQPSNPGGTFANPSISVVPVAGPSAAPTPAPSAAPSAAPTAPASSPAGGGNGSTSSTPPTDSAAGTCNSPGQSVCSPDGKQVGTCDATNHVTFVPVASGTICKGGYMVMAGSAKFKRSHIRHGHSFRRW